MTAGESGLKADPRELSRCLTGKPAGLTFARPRRFAGARIWERNWERDSSRIDKNSWAWPRVPSGRTDRGCT